MDEEHANRDIFTNVIEREYSIPHQLIGLAGFFAVFVVVIPTILYKLKLFNILTAYLPNLDLLATIVSYHGGPTGRNFLSELYLPAPNDSYSFFSQTFINWMSLLGVTYLIARETKITGSILKGWSIGFVILLVTYLLPANFLSASMDKMYGYLVTQPHFPAFQTHRKEKGGHMTWLVSTGFGFLAAVLLIIFEAMLIKYGRHSGLLESFAKAIVDFPKRL